MLVDVIGSILSQTAANSKYCWHPQMLHLRRAKYIIFRLLTIIVRVVHNDGPWLLFRSANQKITYTLKNCVSRPDQTSGEKKRERGVNDARVSKREVLDRRGAQWFRYGAEARVLARGRQLIHWLDHGRVPEEDRTQPAVVSGIWPRF